MPGKARRSKKQIDRIAKARKKSTGRKTVVRGKSSATGKFAVRSGGGASSGARYRAVRAGGSPRGGSRAGREREREATSGAAGHTTPPTPRGGLFHSGDPTLAKRVEDELYRLDG